MDYKKFIKGKSVVYVGACPNLIGKNFGKVIDSYDIVIKSNHSWSFNSKEYVKDYGERCNVVYINKQYYREMNPFPIKIMQERGVKWLCLKGCSKEYKIRYQHYVNVRTIQHVFRDVQSYVKSATMGAYTIYDLLSFKPKKLFVTGIDFFASKKPRFEHNNYQEYLTGYLPDKIRRQGNVINAGKNEDGHNFYENAKFFFNLFRKYENLKTNDFILNLLDSIIKGRTKQGDIKWN